MRALSVGSARPGVKGHGGTPRGGHHGEDFRAGWLKCGRNKDSGGMGLGGGEGGGGAWGLERGVRALIGRMARDAVRAAFGAASVEEAEDEAVVEEAVRWGEQEGARNVEEPRGDRTRSEGAHQGTRIARISKPHAMQASLSSQGGNRRRLQVDHIRGGTQISRDKVSSERLPVLRRPGTGMSGTRAFFASLVRPNQP